MGVSGADFDALVGDLVGALDTFKVGPHGKDQLLGQPKDFSKNAGQRLRLCLCSIDGVETGGWILR